MAVHIRRDHVFEDSYRELHRRSSEEIKNRLYIVFDGEEGQDAGMSFKSLVLLLESMQGGDRLGKVKEIKK